MLPLDTILLSIFAIAALYFPLHLAYFSGAVLARSKLRDAQIFRAFRLAGFHHYILVVLFKAPNLLAAVLVYMLALQLFNVEVEFGQMLAFLPVIFLAAALALGVSADAESGRTPWSRSGYAALVQSGSILLWRKRCASSHAVLRSC